MVFKLFKRRSVADAELPIIDGDAVVTVGRDAEHDAAIRAYVKERGLTIPAKVGERFGYDVKVKVEAAPQYDERGAKAAAYWLGRKRVQVCRDEPDDDVQDVAALLREVARTGRSAAYLRGRLYKGQGGVWRLRVFEP